MGTSLILILVLFACSPLLLFYIIKPKPKVNSYVVSNMKNRNNSKPIGEQFEAVEQIIKNNNLVIDFSGYFNHDE